MLAWCIVLFCLGIAAIFDSFFGYGELFRQVYSVLFMLVSLGLLVRTAIKIKRGTTERLLERIEWLEKRLEDMQPEDTEPRTARKPNSVKA